MYSVASVALLMTVLPSLAQGPPSPTTLAQLRESYRPLLLFAPSPEDPSLLAQLTRLRNVQPGLEERNVLIIVVPFHTPSPSRTTLTPDEAAQARRQFNIPPTDFVAVSIGKDGGEKLRSRKPLSFEKLRATIDSMPMRQREMADVKRGTPHD